MSRARGYLLSLGSNVDPERWVPRALALLTARFDVEAVSPTYDVEAVGPPGQARFANLAVRLQTDLPVRALRAACRHVEALCGRVREPDRFAARTLDLDVVYDAGRRSAEDADLLAEAYVLIPCADIWPDAVLAASGRTLAAEAEARFPDWRARHAAEGP